MNAAAAALVAEGRTGLRAWAILLAMRIPLFPLACLVLVAAQAAPQGAAELAGQWDQASTRTQLVRVPVLRDRPTASLAGRGMVTGRGPVTSTVLRDEDVPMQVHSSVSLRIQPDGRFKWLTEKRRTASPTNDCEIREGTRRDGVASYADGRLVLKSESVRALSLDCDGTGDETREAGRVDVYAVRRQGNVLVLQSADGEVWQLQRAGG